MTSTSISKTSKVYRPERKKLRPESYNLKRSYLNAREEGSCFDASLYWNRQKINQIFPSFKKLYFRLREARELGRRQTSTESSSSNEDAFARRLRFVSDFKTFHTDFYLSATHDKWGPGLVIIFDFMSTCFLPYLRGYFSQRANPSSIICYPTWPDPKLVRPKSFKEWPRNWYFFQWFSIFTLTA